MRPTRWTLGPVLAALVALAPRAQAQAGYVELPRLHPVEERLADQDVAEDNALIAAWHARLLAARAKGPTLPAYPFEKAQRWIDLARDAYELNARGTVASDALGEASKLVRTLEQGNVPDLAAGTVTPVYAPRVRLDLWRTADQLRGHPELPRAAAEVAALELALVRAALEAARMLPCPDKPQRVAEAMAKRATELLDRPRVVAVTPPRVDTLVMEAPKPAPKAPVMVTKTPEVLRGVPPNVHFGLNQDVLSAASQKVLAAAADSLLRYGSVSITLSGNTDSRGNVAYNTALSKRRAEAVKAFLVARGIAAERVKLEALGKGNLKTGEKDVVDLARNRRVDITYVTAEGKAIETREGLDDLQVEARRPAPARRPAAPKAATPKPAPLPGPRKP
ncbi:MAG: OmpA family protein [Gemmatimonadetes bacterium]|nr:OmpA family protein [Gemmatimonadota bacterium]